MSKLPAKSSQGVGIKALVITTIMKAWQCGCDDLWSHVEHSDKLLLSLLDEALNAGLAEVQSYSRRAKAA